MVGPEVHLDAGEPPMAPHSYKTDGQALFVLTM